MSSLPGRIKRLILPAWNAGHRTARNLGMVTSALASGNLGNCVVCGRKGIFLYRRDVIPSRLQEIWGLNERLAAAFARKETDFCSRCGSNLRARRIARVLLDELNEGRATSIADWVEVPEVRRLRVAEINGIGGLHDWLSTLPNLSYSDFEPSVEPGTNVNGVRSESLMGLTYPDETFDLVLTSETLEHIPNLGVALAEIRRILVPDGLHIFTIPWLPTVPTTFARAAMTGEGRIAHDLPLIHHPGGDVGYPVFTEFGLDLPRILDEAGFDTKVVFGPPSEEDVAQVFVCRKRS